MAEPMERPPVFVDDAKLSEQIQDLLAKSGYTVDLIAIRMIMKHQTNNYENLGIIKIVYKPAE